jgi:hypothetical protein
LLFGAAAIVAFSSHASAVARNFHNPLHRHRSRFRRFCPFLDSRIRDYRQQ